MATPTFVRLWNTHRAAIAALDQVVVDTTAWRAAQGPRTQWSAHTQLAAKGHHHKLVEAAARGFEALMNDQRQALFGKGFSFAVPSVSRKDLHLSWRSAALKSELSLAQPHAIAFLWGLVLGLEQGLLDPSHPVRLEWSAYADQRPQTTFDLILGTAFRSLDFRRVGAPDPVQATAVFRAAIEGSVEHTASNAESAFAQGHAHGQARARLPFCWTAAPTWWKDAFSSPAGKKLHPSVATPQDFHLHFEALDRAIKAADAPSRSWVAPLEGVRERMELHTRGTHIAQLQAAYTPLNAALAHASRLAGACGTPPSGPKGLWIVQDSSNAARHVKAWSGTSAVLAHALDRMGTPNPSSRSIPTSMRLWKAWPETAEDGHEARSLAP
jgi:hypothetical protein